MDTGEIKTEETVEAIFLNGSNEGQKVQGQLIDGMVYHFENKHGREEEYVCTTTLDGSFVLYLNHNYMIDRIAVMLSGYYF